MDWGKKLHGLCLVIIFQPTCPTQLFSVLAKSPKPNCPPSPTKAALEPLFNLLIIDSGASHQGDGRFRWWTNILSIIRGNERHLWILTGAKWSPCTGQPYHESEIERCPHIFLIQSHSVHFECCVCVFSEYRKGLGLAEIEIKGFLYAARVLKKITI